jgi:hypothetical protein
MAAEQNLWTDLDPNKILQYHMAEIIKEDPYLEAAMEQTCDLYVGVFKNYKKIVDKKIFNNQKKVVTHADKNAEGQELNYLPGKEQMLAYSFNLRLRWLWYGMQNPQVICKACGINVPKSIAKLVNLGLRRLAYRKHKFDPSKIHTDIESELKYRKDISYVEVWQIIKERLMARMQKISQETGEPLKTDFVSFDDHGWVMSFDPEIVHMQNTKLAEKQSHRAFKGTILDDVKIARDFGFAGIESWWGTEMPTFYKV